MSAQLYLESGVSYLWLLYKPHIIHLLQTVINPAALPGLSKNCLFSKIVKRNECLEEFRLHGRSNDFERTSHRREINVVFHE